MLPDAQRALIGLLNDGEFHSGEDIARLAGCSRAAVWKQIEGLRQWDLPIEAQPGRGYRLQEPVELLDESLIRCALDPAAADSLSTILILPDLPSTNDRLLSLSPSERHGTLVLAEHQSAGRGRRGRKWVSPFARNIYMSLGWRFETGLADLGCLPLVVAIAVCSALESAGLEAHGIKWPNDLLIHSRKAGGCLVEVQGDVNGPCTAVIGLGLNFSMPQRQGKKIDQSWTDLRTHLPDVTRNQVTGLVLSALLLHLEEFSQAGFAPLRQEWERWDLLHGRATELLLPDQTVLGIAAGISDNGSLRLQSNGTTREYSAGEVSINRKDS